MVTDPPYGETQLEWDRWPEGWLADAAAIADSLWCFGTMRMFFDHLPEFNDAWKFAQDVVWEKQNGSGMLRDRFRRVHETATHWYRGAWADIHHDEPRTDVDVVARTVRKRSAKGPHLHGARGESSYSTTTGGTKLIRSVLRVRSEHMRGIHPTQKPLGILTPLVEYSAPRGGLIVDLFAGSASVALAARQAGRRCISFEANQTYALAAAARLAQREFDLGELA